MSRILTIISLLLIVTGIYSEDYSKGISPNFKMATGGRSRVSIMQVVMQNVTGIKKLYDVRLLKKPGLSGRVTVGFGIDQLGNVLFCKVINSTVNDLELETQMLDFIRQWKFDKIDKPFDVTEVEYPFVFEARKGTARVGVIATVIALAIAACVFVPAIIIDRQQ